MPSTGSPSRNVNHIKGTSELDSSRGTSTQKPGHPSALGITDLSPSEGLVGTIHGIIATTPDDVQRVAAVVHCCAEWTYDQQQWLRRNLRASLAKTGAEHSGGYQRPGHRRDWIQHSTAPMADKISAPTLERLNAGLLALIGIEPVIALTDVGGHTRQETVDTLAWAAIALTEQALRQTTKTMSAASP